MNQAEIVNELRLMEARIKVLLSMLSPAKPKRRKKVDYSEIIKQGLAKKEHMFKK